MDTSGTLAAVGQAAYSSSSSAANVPILDVEPDGIPNVADDFLISLPLRVAALKLRAKRKVAVSVLLHDNGEPMPSHRPVLTGPPHRAGDFQGPVSQPRERIEVGRRSPARSKNAPPD